MRRQPVVGAAAVLATCGVVATNPRARRRVAATIHRGARTAHYLRGRLRGALYRASGAVPDPMALDGVVADRVRTRLGRLVRSLDVPHVHVTVCRHVATLHGEVRTRADAAAIERSAAAVPGVFRVHSELHVGLSRSDTPPSSGRLHGRGSAMLGEMLAVAQDCGLQDGLAMRAVHAVVSRFGELLPDGERHHLASHLPADVRAMLQPDRRRRRHPRVRTADDFIDGVAERAGIDRFTVAPVAEALLATLRDRVPEEADDVAAVLPERIRRWWQVAIPA